MKRMFLSTLIVASMLGMLVACGSSGTDTPVGSVEEPESKEESAPEAEASGAKGKVAGVVFQEDQFMKLLQLGYQNAAEAAGYEFIPGNTNNDQGKEADLIHTYCEQKIAGIAISPLSEKTSEAGLKKAADEGIQISLSNTTYEGDFFAGCYSSDNYELGKSTGEAAKAYIEENLDGTANIAVIQYKSLLSEQSTARSSGFLDVVLELPGVTVVDDQDAWLQDKAITVVTDMLTAHPEIDLIFAANDGGTIGTVMAVQNTGNAGKIVVFGTDASEQMVSLLKDESNILQAVTGQDPYEIGMQTMQTLIDAIEGKDVSASRGQLTIVPGILLSRDDPDGLDTYLADLLEKTS
ncbi:MAG: sugar ABC transporter substrate-binding protein [Lachnospiraceae bacterium]|nr:sugar ABC transporter substrate-binding protein [Lachnospiraceae bacterium]